MHSISIQQLYHLREQAQQLVAIFGFNMHVPFSSGCFPIRADQNKSSGMEFYEHRPYQAGDKPGAIDWRVTARMHTPWVKVCREEKDQVLLLLLDMTTGIFFTSQSFCKSVIALQVFALLGWLAIDQGYQVGGILMTEQGCITLSTGKGEQHFYNLLTQVVQYHKKSQQFKSFDSRDPACFGRAIYQFTQFAPKGSHAVLISDFISLNNCAFTHLTIAAARHSLMAVRISDPLESGQCPKGIFPVSDGNQAIILLCKDESMRQRFSAYCKQYFSRIADYFTNQRIPLFDLDTHQHAEQQLSAVLQKNIFEATGQG